MAVLSRGFWAALLLAQLGCFEALKPRDNPLDVCPTDAHKDATCAVCNVRFTGPTCEQCASRFTGESCDQCLPQFTGSRCEECAPKFAGPNCERCADDRYTGADCTECSNDRFTGPACDQCMPGFTQAGNDCVCEHTQCGRSCADLSSDDANCGSCGHSCGGAGCQFGACNGTLIATVPNIQTSFGFSAGKVASDDQNLYVVTASESSEGSLTSISKKTGQVELVYPDFPPNAAASQAGWTMTPFKLVVDRGVAFVGLNRTNGTSQPILIGRVISMPVPSPGPVTEVVPYSSPYTELGPDEFTVDGSSIYYHIPSAYLGSCCGTPPPKLQQRPRDGGDVITLVAPSPDLSSLQTDGTSLYFTNFGKLYRAPIMQGSSVAPLGNWDAIGAFLLDGPQLFVSGHRDNQFSIDLADSSGNRLKTLVTGTALGQVARSGSQLFFVQQVGSDTSMNGMDVPVGLFRTAADGTSTPTLVTVAGSSAHGFGYAVDEQYVFVLDSTSGEIRRVSWQ